MPRKRKKSKQKEVPKTLPRLTRFEYAKIKGARALAIQKGGKLMFKDDEMRAQGIDLSSPQQIADFELANKRFPMYIWRQLPGGKRIRIDPNEMLLP